MQYWFTLGGFEPLVQVNDLKCKILAVRGPQLWVCALGWTSWGCTLSLCYMFYLFHAETIVLLYKALWKKAGQIIPSSLEHFSSIETPAVQTWLTWWVSVCSCSSKSRSTWKMLNQPEPDALLGNTGWGCTAKGIYPEHLTGRGEPALFSFWISNIESELSWSFLGHWRHLLEMGINCSKNVHDRMNKEHFWEVYIYTLPKLFSKCYTIFHLKVLFEDIWINSLFIPAVVATEGQHFSF